MNDTAGIVGSTIGDRYRIEGVLGEGASAVVYAAHDMQLDRSVALKIPRLPLGIEAGAGERIAHEVRAAARLHDWHIVTIFDVIEVQRRPIIVMERVRGKSLAAVLRERGTLPLSEAVAIAEGIARALAAAHAAGIIHRDVKPSNVLLTEDGEVKLTDFGVARAFADEQARLTQTGIVVGSVFYLAPELMAGQEPTPSVDLYALGAVIHQMLLGEPPFTGRDPVTIALAHATQPVPSLRGVAGIPPAFAQLVERLLAKTPAERPADAATVAEECATWAASLAATDPLAAPTVMIAAHPAPPKQTPAPLRKPTRRVPRNVATTTLACAFVAGIALLAWPHDVIVPAFSANAATAQRQLAQANLRVSQVGATSLTVPNGAIIRADPQPGAHVAPGSTIRLTVSTGLPFVQVPEIVGRDEAAAATIVRAAGLRLQTRSQVSDAPPNAVIQQSPAAGASLRQHAGVIAIVSSGPQLDAEEAAGPAWCNNGAASKEQLENAKRDIDRQEQQVDAEFDGAAPRDRELVKAQLEAQKHAIDRQEHRLDQERGACVDPNRGFWWER